MSNEAISAAQLQALVAQLRDPADQTREAAAKRLCGLGTQANSVATPLVAACDDECEAVREWLVATLEEIGPPPESDAEQLAALLKHKSPLVGYWAATLLGRLQSAGRSAVGSLAQVLTSSADLSVRQCAAWALGEIGVDSPAAREALIAAATDKNPRLARMAKKALQTLDDLPPAGAE